MALSAKERKKLLELLQEEDQANEEILQEEETEVHPNRWQRFLIWLTAVFEKVERGMGRFFAAISTSKAFDFFVNISIAFMCGMFCFYIPKWFLVTFPKVPSALAETLLLLGITGAKFFIARLIIDISLFFSENVDWNFLKRNGDNSFDFQENLKSLTPWQQNVISLVKYLGYLFLFALLTLT